MKALRVLAALEDRVGRVLIYAIILLTTAQVFFRYVLNHPLGWTEEVARYVFIWAIFLGAAVVARSREHVSVKLFHPYVSPGIRKALRVFNDICIIVFLAAIIPSAWRYALYSYRLKATVTEVPMFFVYVSVPVCSALIIAHTLENIYRDLRDRGANDN